VKVLFHSIEYPVGLGLLARLQCRSLDARASASQSQNEADLPLTSNASTNRKVF